MAFSSQNIKTKHEIEHNSNIITSLGATRLTKEAKLFRELDFHGFVCCFSIKIKQSLKNHWKMVFLRLFWLIFWVLLRFLNFDWKTAHQTKESKNCNKFCFFWHPKCPTTWDNSGVNKICSFFPSVIEFLRVP